MKIGWNGFDHEVDSQSESEQYADYNINFRLNELNMLTLLNRNVESTIVGIEETNTEHHSGVRS